MTNASGDAQFTGCEIDKPGCRLRHSRECIRCDAGDHWCLHRPGRCSFRTRLHELSGRHHERRVDAPTNGVGCRCRRQRRDDGHARITLTINKNAGTFSCTGGTSKAAVNGVATFSGCLQTTIADNYRLTADDGAGGLAAKQGANFDVTTTGVANKLAFCWGTANACQTAPPTDAVAGVAFSAQPSIRVTDAGGNTITSDSTTVVNLAILAGTPTSGGPGTLTCTGGLAKTVVNGVANFTGCMISTAGTGYRLNATSSPVLTPAPSQAFNVLSASAPSKLAFITGAALTVVAGQSFSNVQVAIEGANNAVVTSGITATIKLALGTHPGGANLNCTGGETATTVNGVATFTGCSVNRVGGYTLRRDGHVNDADDHARGGHIPNLQRGRRGRRAHADHHSTQCDPMGPDGRPERSFHFERRGPHGSAAGFPVPGRPVVHVAR